MGRGGQGWGARVRVWPEAFIDSLRLALPCLRLRPTQLLCRDAYPRPG